MMKILWITNILFPEALSKLTDNSELRSSGGWMLGAANALMENSDFSLYVATVSTLVKELTRINGERIIHYVIPYGKGNLRENPEYQKYWKRINEEICPDVVHIHGTEYSHGHAYMKLFGSEKIVVSVQGLKSAIYHYYCAGVSKSDIYRNITLRDIFRGTMLQEQRDMQISSRYEVDMLKMARHVIGRTSWDRARTWAINPAAEYHFCNETLREEFYDGSLWSSNKCKKYTIFLSQAGYPIKGLHQLLKAMPLILMHYPQTQVRIAGRDITKCMSFSDIKHFTGYGLYVKRLIKKLGLCNKVHFIGSLNATQMKAEYLNCNVFVCPSSIENSPNSLGEAQTLGVPCVASYVGGVPDMMNGNEENLFRFEEVEMLAEKICRVFGQEENKINMRNVAALRHDREANALELIKIYSRVTRQ